MRAIHPGGPKIYRFFFFLRERLFTFAGSLFFRSDEIFTSDDSNADIGEWGAGVHADFSSIICTEKVSSLRCLVLSAYTHKKGH